MRAKSVFFGILGSAVAVCAVLAVLFFRNQMPMLLQTPREATACIETVMQAICDQDYAKAESMLYGQPDLGMDGQPEGVVNQAFWNAFLDSLDYELVGQIHATESGLAQDVKIISLELLESTSHLRQRAEILLQQGIAQAENTEDVYDKNNSFKDSFVDAVMRKAAAQVLEEDVRYGYQIVTLQLVFEDNQWWVVADKALLNAISGGTVG